MDNLNDLKAIWHTAKTDDLPRSEEMLRIVKKFRNQKLGNKWIMISIALFTSALMVVTMFVFHSVMITTRIGELLTIAACVVLAATNIRSLKRFYELNDCSNKEFIAFLEQTRINQVRFYKKAQVVGLSFSSAGLLLYLYELVYSNTLVLIITYTITVLWILFMWFYIRPGNFKKQAVKLNATLEKLNEISKQIK